MIKTITPKVALDVPSQRRAVKKALAQASRQVRILFDRTTATWGNSPEFEISVGDTRAEISTDSEIYGYIDDGTKPHIIRPRGGRALAFNVPYSAKTAPGVIGSRSGRTGNTLVVTRYVNHPGTDARNFSATIAEQAEDIFQDELQKAINEVTP